MIHFYDRFSLNNEHVDQIDIFCIHASANGLFCQKSILTPIVGFGFLYPTQFSLRTLEVFYAKVSFALIDNT